MKNSITQLAALILVCTIFCAASCKKEEKGPQLPPETHVGAYTIGFKVDGKAYTAKGKEGLLSNQFVYYNIRASDSSIHIGASSSVDKFYFDATIKYDGLQPVYLAKSYPYTASFQDNSNGTITTGGNTFNTTDQYQGRFVIKYFTGTLNPVDPGTMLSGTFEMEAVNANGRVIHITEGRFDIGF